MDKQNNKNHNCNFEEQTLCLPMQKFSNALHLRGIKRLNGYNPENRSFVIIGFEYKHSKKDETPILLNYCPWCQEKVIDWKDKIKEIKRNFKENKKSSQKLDDSLVSSGL